MCCEICPSYAKCEEEGNLTNLCCAGCPDKRSCGEDGVSEDKDKEGSAPEDEMSDS